MKKYCFVIPKLSSGGAERAISVFASGIAELGYDVSLIIYKRTPEEYPVSDLVKKYYRCDEEYSSNKVIIFLQKLRYVRRFLKDNQIDVVVPFLENCVIHTFVASRGLKIKYVSSLRNNPYMLSKKERRRTDFITALADAHFVQNHMQKEYYSKAIQKKTFIVTNPVSDAFIENEKQYRNDIKKIVAVGRLNEQKNYYMLIDAMKIVLKEFSDIQLEIYGEGSEEDKLKQYINDNGLENNIHLMGRSEDIKSVYNNSDVYVMTSDYEGMPNSLLEALTFGMPSISTDCPTGPSELIEDGVNGYLVPMGDSKVLAERLIDYIKNPKKAEEFGKAARKSCGSSHSKEAVCKKLVQYLDRV